MRQIWVDADAVPNVIKEILFRTAEREKINITLIANRLVSLPPSAFLKSYQVSQGFDEADNAIVGHVNKGDLVITADIPLANDVLHKEAKALNPRGYFYDLDTIEAQLTMRDFNETMRSSGLQTRGPNPMTQKERQLFSNLLDTWLRKSP